MLLVSVVSLGISGLYYTLFVFFFSSRRRHTRLQGDWSSDVCSSDLSATALALERQGHAIVGSGRRPIPMKTTKGERLVREAAFKAFDEEKQVGFAEVRSEERRVGKEGRSRGAPYH